MSYNTESVWSVERNESNFAEVFTLYDWSSGVLIESPGLFVREVGG